MDLFSNNQISSLLPFDGNVLYFGSVLSVAEANHYYNELYNTIEWKHDETILFGKHLITKRKVAWYGNKAFDYSYSKTTKKALPWTNDLLLLKKIVEEKTESTYNSCLLNLYHDGKEGMSWHSDNETSLQQNASIASLSFGADRKFCFKHKYTKNTISMILEHGSLLLMKGVTQTFWNHSLPKSTKVKGCRINLTFRKMLD